jgi:hypothetical protein
MLTFIAHIVEVLGRKPEEMWRDVSLRRVDAAGCALGGENLQWMTTLCRDRDYAAWSEQLIKLAFSGHAAGRHNQSASRKASN